MAALARARQRAKRGMFLVEGPQGMREALLRHARKPLLDAVYVTEDFLAGSPEFEGLLEDLLAAPTPEGRRVFVRLVTAEVLAAMSDAQSPQGILGVAQIAAALGSDPLGEHSAADSAPDSADPGHDAAPRLLAALARVQDPGNAGTLVRAADAAGAQAVIASAGSVDLFNPKTVRSTAGSLFHVGLTSGADLSETAARAKAAGLQVLAAHGRGSLDLDDLADAAARDRASQAPLREGVDLRRPTLWLFGNEAQGLSPAELELADAAVAVPLYGAAESLNVGTAATVCLYASARAQRPAPTGQEEDAQDRPADALKAQEPTAQAPADQDQTAQAPKATVVGAAILDSLERPRRLLVAQRSYPEALAGLWEFPGGKAEPGETLAGALEREIREELGCGVVLGEQLPAPQPQGWPLSSDLRLQLFTGQIHDGAAQAGADHRQLRWMSREDPEELLGLPWIPADLPILRALLEHLGIRQPEHP